MRAVVALSLSTKGEQHGRHPRRAARAEAEARVWETVLV